MRRALQWLALAVAPTLAWSHHAWLLPANSMASGKDPLVFIDAASSEDLFEFDNRGLAVDRWQVTGPDSKLVPTTPPNTASRHRTSLEFSPPIGGSYRVSAVSEVWMVSYQLAGEVRRFRGTPAAWALARPEQASDIQTTRLLSRVETFVARDAAGPVANPVEGQGIELLALGSAVDLSVGDSSRFRVLLDGKPWPEAAITLLRGGNRYRYRMGELNLKTDAEGYVNVPWTEAGRWWLGISQARAASPGAEPQASSSRASYSATFEVLPR